MKKLLTFPGLLAFFVFYCSAVDAGESAWHHYMKLAVAASQRGDYAEAEKHLQSATTQANKSKNKVWLAITLNQLGLVYQEEDEYEKAEQLFKRALLVSEKALGPNHPQVATCLEHCASASRKRGKILEAARLADRAETCLKRCAVVMRMKGKNEEAATLEARAKAISAERSKRE